jgi:hypothetical protein
VTVTICCRLRSVSTTQLMVPTVRILTITESELSTEWIFFGGEYLLWSFHVKLIWSTGRTFFRGPSQNRNSAPSKKLSPTECPVPARF